MTTDIWANRLEECSQLNGSTCIEITPGGEIGQFYIAIKINYNRNYDEKKKENDKCIMITITNMIVELLCIHYYIVHYYYMYITIILN